MKYGGVTLPTHDDYQLWHAAFGECYPDIMVGDLAGAEGIWDAGKLPVIHPMFKWPEVDATIQNIAAGRYDTQIDAWLDTLKAYCDTGRKAIVAWLPEFNGNWTVYATDDASPSSFIATWDYVVNQAFAIGLDQTMVKWCWAPNNFGIGDLADWWPGYADLIGGSAYNMGGLYPDVPWETFTYLADKYVREIRGFTDLPILITQTGTPLGDSRSPGWLDGAVSYTINWDNIIGLVYYSEGEFEWGPGRDDFNQRMQPLSAERPDHWFQEEPMPHYPPAVAGEPAETYGPLPTHGHTTVAVVLHTTETAGFPGFSENDVAPHYVYAPQTRTWTRMAEYEDGYVGTLKGHTTGGHGNCKAFQVEILAYSNPDRDPWVGDFTDDNYRDLADFLRWARDRYGIGDMVTPTPTNGWLYGTSSPHRMTDTEWADFDGLTAHGAVPRNTHWDTGILDLQRIHDLAEGDDDLMDYGRHMAYVQEGDTGFAVEEAQVKIIQAVKGIAYYGNSNRVFVETEAPTLTFKDWDMAMTTFFSQWTGRNSYGYGPTEKIMVDEAIRNL